MIYYDKITGRRIAIADATADYDQTIPERMTFVSRCKCIKCGETFHGRFYESARESITCPYCHETLTYGDR